MKTFTRRRKSGGQDAPASAAKTPLPAAKLESPAVHPDDDEQLQEETESLSALRIRDRPTESDARVGADAKAASDGVASRKRNLMLSPVSQQVAGPRRGGRNAFRCRGGDQRLAPARGRCRWRRPERWLHQPAKRHAA
jgi:hypothetical protein